MNQKIYSKKDAQRYRRLKGVMRKPKHIIRPYFKWFDIWVGAFYDATKRWLYIQPLPMCGVLIDLFDYDAHSQCVRDEIKQEQFEDDYR